MGMRPFRFIGQAATGLEDPAELIATASEAEAVGYHGLALPDHLLEQYAPIPVLATVAAVTERLTIGTFVLNSGLRHPAVLAQDLATLDVLSGGRLWVGIGAGWNRPEHDAIGLPFDRPAARFARLGEALDVLDGCFGDGPFSYSGEYYTITDHDALPKPVQRPRPPYFVGGGGRRILTLAGQRADIVGLAPRVVLGDVPRPDPKSFTAEATEEKVAWVRAGAGDRFDQIELNTYPSGGPVVITPNAKAEAGRRADQLSQATGAEVSIEEILESPHVFIGTVDGLCQKIVELRDRFGISSFMLGEVETAAPIVERLAGR